MPDVYFFNYPYNQYTFTASELKRVLLRQQGCDEWSARLPNSGGPRWIYGSAGGCCGNGPTLPYPCGPLTYPFVYQ
jgi:hypothetical protein